VLLVQETTGEMEKLHNNIGEGCRFSGISMDSGAMPEKSQKLRPKYHLTYLMLIDDGMASRPTRSIKFQARIFG